MNQTGGELERRRDTSQAPYLQGRRHGELADVVDWPELAAWARGRGVLLGGLALIAAQLIWKSFFLGHFYFRQDDFHVLELALGHSLGWRYLTFVGAGHLIPGVYVIAWAAARISLYSWALASTITVVLLAGAGLAALRLLRTLFGDRPAILVPLVVYLLSPLTMPDLGLWTSAIESLPLQIATFMALNAQVHYVRTGRYRHAVAASAWLLFGLLFFEKALVLPLLLLGVTSAFLVDDGGSWLRATGQCLVRYWRAWALQVIVVAAYVAVFAVSLHTSTVRPAVPRMLGGVASFISEIMKDTFVPGAVGGPWQWAPSGDAEYAYANPPAALAWLSVIVAVAVIGASIWSRIRAWRAWAILAGWLAAADIAPVLLGRMSGLSPQVLGLETRYVADAVPVLAVCLGLAFWPVAGRPDAVSRRWAVAGPSQFARTVAAGVTGAFIIGSVWSAQAYQNVTSSVPDRIFIANARAALSEVPAGALISDQPVPPALMLGLFGRAADASQVVGPMATGAAAARIRWTTRPDGTFDNFLVFDGEGRLHQAAVYGRASMPLPPGQSCQRASRGSVVVDFTSPTPDVVQVLHVAYLAGPTVSGDYAIVSYGRSSYVLTVRRGLHNAFFTVRGSADSVTLSGPAIAGLCVGGVQAGLVVPSPSGPVIPARS